MSMGYIRRTYGVPAKRGQRVEWHTRNGTRHGVIVSATRYVNIRFDGERRPRPLHPKEPGLVYLDGEVKT